MSLDSQSPPDDIETLWRAFHGGDVKARERILTRHYEEFRKVARRVLAGDGDKLQIQPTELAHEAAIRFLKFDRLDIRDKAHFLALSSRIMRQILLDEVRRFKASKRRMPTVETVWVTPGSEQAPVLLDLEAFDQALERLAQFDPEKAKIVEQRFFAGLTIEEIAHVSGISESTVKRQWRGARAWIISQLEID